MDARFEKKHNVKFHDLLSFLARVPAIKTNGTPSGGFGSGDTENGLWWVKLTIDIRHALAWQTIQELGFVLNYLSLEERLPCVFKPVSPPPYMNGGPEDFLSWVIEECEPRITPTEIAQWLEGRLPKPVDDPASWNDEITK